MDEVILENQEETQEQKLVSKFLMLHEETNRLTALAAEKKKERNEVEAQLIDLLNDENKKSSGVFKGIGHVTCLEPAVGQAYVLDGQEEILFEHLRQVGREDLIKTSVHHTSLAAYINQCLKARTLGEDVEIPPGVDYKLVQKLRAYPEKTK